MQITRQQRSYLIFIMFSAAIVLVYVLFSPASQETAADQHYALGVVYDDNHKEEEAIAQYTKAIRLSPGFTEAYAARCSAQATLERYAEALEDCNRAIELDPDMAWGYGKRCIVLAETGHIEQAIADCNRAIQLAPNDGYVYGSLGRLHNE